MTEAEQGVIGCSLIDSKSLYDVYNNLKAEMFSSEFYRDCYSEILAMYDNGEPINVLSVSQRMESRQYDVETIGTELKQCMLSAPTSAMIKSYGNTIVNEYRARSAKELFQRVSFQPKDINNTIAEILLRFEELQGNMEVRSKSLKQIVQENKGKYFNEHVGEGLIKTGFAELDDCLGGLEGGDITVIGARPGVGKSAIVTQMIGQIACSGERVGYFNLEMNESQVYERFVSRIAELSLVRVRRAKNFLGEEELKFSQANDELETYDVVISTGSKSISEVRAESRHQNFDIIIIDYLQLIKADRHYGNRSSEVGDISKAVKALASELHIPIILLSQLNRLSEQKETKEPTMSELRESGDIEQDASNILLMWNLSETNRSYKGLKVEKQRQGENKKMGLTFDGSHMKFVESKDPFEKFLNMAKNDNATQGFVNADFASTPFD